MTSPTKRANRNTATYRLEKQYICFYDGAVDLAWAVNDVAKFRGMWDAGHSIKEIAIELKRHPVEVTLLLIDLAETEDATIERRPVSIYEGVGAL
jgi:hypothetical protein